MSGAHLKAYAKVNLSLEVLGRRPDGYHEVRTVLQTIDLADDVTLSPAGALLLDVTLPSPLPPGENLALRAAQVLRQETGRGAGARIRLVKRIPEAAGLGGGSADAATVLVGLNHLWGLDLTPEELARVAVSLGSDVPFFVRGGTAVATGRGEQVTPLPSLPERWLVVLVPPLSVAPTGGRGKTGHMYTLLGPEHYTDGCRTARLVEALRAGHDVSGLPFNVFEAVAEEAFPGLDRYREALHRAGAPQVHLAGSGPALFGLFPTKAEAEQAYASLARKGYAAYLACTAGPRPPVISFRMMGDTWDKVSPCTS